VYVFVSVPVHSQLPTNGSADPESPPPLLLPLAPPLLLPLAPPLLLPLPPPLLLLPLELPLELLPPLLLLHAMPTARAPVSAAVPRRSRVGEVIAGRVMSTDSTDR
jgi:hypothetical protein